MATAASKAVQVVLLDIEGTVCPISFVKDVLSSAGDLCKTVAGNILNCLVNQARVYPCPLPLPQYPYSLRALPALLESKWDSAAFAPYRNSFPAEHRTSPAALSSHVQDLVSRDVKASYLKSLQGLLWKEGYETGALKAPLYGDVLPALTRWHAAGIILMIYSSGSVPAQKLLFQHTEAIKSDGQATEDTGSSLGTDITPILSDYFDTVNAGPKTAAESYSKILAAYSKTYPTSSRWLFLSDNVLEVEAAHAAGLQSYVVQRPGNAPLAESVAQKHKVITTFEGLEL